MAESLAKSLEDDKAEDLLFIDLQGKSSLADFMIIASGRSGRHVAALADHISQEAKKLTGRPASIEGMPIGLVDLYSAYPLHSAKRGEPLKYRPFHHRSLFQMHVRFFS